MFVCDCLSGLSTGLDICLIDTPELSYRELRVFLTTFKRFNVMAFRNPRSVLCAAVTVALGLNATVSAGDIKYTYDALGRMIEADYDTAGRVDQYCYDALGNRLERIISASGGTCPTPGGPGSGGGPIQITNPGTLVVQAAHSSTYFCSTSFFWGVTLESCQLSGSGFYVYQKVNANPPTYDAGYSGRLEVTAAAYGSGQTP